MALSYQVIQLCDELSCLTGCLVMWEWLIYNHPVSLTIFSPLQLNINGEKSVGLTISSQ